MDKVHKNLQMVTFILAVTLMVNLQVMENIIGQIVVFLKEPLKMV
jgi:hypothetical protein